MKFYPFTLPQGMHPFTSRTKGSNFSRERESAEEYPTYVSSDILILVFKI
jgi:hypothetical protein